LLSIIFSDFLAKLFLPLVKVVEKEVKICKSNNNRRKMLPGKDTNKDEGA
jgi:hypothetical protein